MTADELISYLNVITKSALPVIGAIGLIYLKQIKQLNRLRAAKEEVAEKKREASHIAIMEILDPEKCAQYKSAYNNIIREWENENRQISQLMKIKI